MTDTKIHLMAFEPKANVETTVYTVGMPEKLKKALFKLMPSKKKEDCLRTNELKAELRCWLDEAVELKALRVDDPCDEWLVALKPVNLMRFCNVIANWLSCTCDKELHKQPLFRETMQMLQPSLFRDCYKERTLCLFDEQGRPSEEAGGLTFPVFAAQVANTLVGKPLVLHSGETLKLSRLSYGTQNGYELISEVSDYKGCPYAFGLRFHVETLPITRKARLNVDVRVKRYVPGKWTDNPCPYMGDMGVNACVRTDGGTWCVVPYRYRGDSKQPEWDELAKENYESFGLAKLPSMEDYFAHMAEHALGKCTPQIVSPLALANDWSSSNYVASGVSMLDKKDVFEALADALADYVDAVEPLSSVNSTSLRTSFDDATSKMWAASPDEAEAVHEKWAKANRCRLAACTGESSIVFELVGTTDDREVLECVKGKIVSFLGAEGEHDGVDVRIVQSFQDELLAPLTGSDDAAAKLRWRKIASKLAPADRLTACVVVLPGKEKFRDKKESKDPKAAIRIGMARTGRLTQFIVPDTGGNLEHRAEAAVRDLMRQMGFVPEFKATRGTVDLNLPTIGLCLYKSSRTKMTARFPVAVRMELGAGLVTVDCPLLSGKHLPYWKAQLELANLSSSPDYKGALSNVNGLSLKSMIESMAFEAKDEALLLVQAYSDIRHRDWWPGISDTNLAQGRLRYGPTTMRVNGEEKQLDSVPFEFDVSKLSVLRVRSGANGEVPDWFTDEKEPTERGRACYCKQGLFACGDYVLGLTAKPHNRDYDFSLHSKKADNPGQRYNEKTLNEYCLLTPGGEELMLNYAKYAEALRGNMVQLLKSDMKVNLPAPLHLAACMGEYIWEPENPKRAKRGFGKKQR